MGPSSKEQGLIGLVHGDDFLVAGEDAGLQWLNKLLNSKYTARWEATLGEDGGDQREMFFLNRVVRYIPDGTDNEGPRLEIEADARHADILVREFGFDERAKGLEVPEEKMSQADLVEAENQPVLDKENVVKFRSMVMRLAYLSVDRPDLCHAVRMLASAMKSPKLHGGLATSEESCPVPAEEPLPEENLCGAEVG